LVLPGKRFGWYPGNPVKFPFDQLFFCVDPPPAKRFFLLNDLIVQAVEPKEIVLEQVAKLHAGNVKICIIRQHAKAGALIFKRQFIPEYVRYPVNCGFLIQRHFYGFFTLIRNKQDDGNQQNGSH